MAIGLIPLIVAIASLAVGSFLGYLARQSIAKRQADTVEAKIDKLITEAKTQAQEIILRAKDKAVKALDEIKKEEVRREEEFRRNNQRFARKEELLENKAESLEQQESDLKEKVEKVREIKTELERLKEEEIQNLEKISKLSQEEAKKEILKSIEEKNKEEIFAKIQKLEKFGKEELEKKAQDIMVSALQRYASSQAAEITTTTISLPNDEIKGKIIGREGRNIKTLERLTGVEVIIDDTPETLLISGFNPIRRQIAKMALEKLISDGRIQPARIEEVVEKTKDEIDKKIREAGEAAVYDVGIVGLDPRLINLLGRLTFRTSFGQNVLLHSIESAHLAAMLASELGGDVTVAKKAALLHDIGKAVDHEIQGSHVDIGIKILQKFGVDKKVIDAMKSHHEDYPFETIEASIVQAAEAVSAARPGARKESLENYLKRLEELEKIATAFEGVDKAYAIQAGREIRVFVNPEKIDDLEAYKLAKDIAQEIEKELKYPGEIKVSLIRETRVIEYAR
ncbi:MAG: ribonuclease Y [Candidatus Portnoybacteria bacterium CG10_big_fil_rev_8_21_14_0_10_38_18]|uniref:Ribonuclease Y n=1 Tax=Candidatus Portnoybacteria bacterium CG10_big_fil_rev_8_21_14_0_10_38_18 TaxID=1974813 RepID=A0A2M8KC26_9BACT|nr:MAG: ribonuclease Y [Candidatus Portnoybacteria bacterium CG10_big_fil_rev_8_21_14_0_10_38_18]